MRENGKVDYNEYNYKGYVWHEEGRENLPERRRAPQKAEKDQKTKKKRERRFDKEGAFVAVTVLLCFLITFVVAETVGGADLLSVFDKKTETGEVYYAVSVEKFDDESLAAISADELRKLGGGGYVIRDGSYYLISSVYEKKEDAEKVAAGMGSYSAEIYEIKIIKPALKWCKTADKSAVEEVLTYAGKIFSGLYDISVEIDKGNISESQAIVRIKTLYAKITSLTANLDKITVKKDDFNLIRLHAELTAALAMLDNLQNDALTRYSIVSDVRYTYTAVLAGYKNLTPSI